MNDASHDLLMEQYIASERKSPLVAFLLALLVGPIGAIYGAPLGGTVLCVITLALALVHPGLVALCWLFGIFLGPAGAADHNNRIEAKARLMGWRGHE